MPTSVKDFFGQVYNIDYICLRQNLNSVETIIQVKLVLTSAFSLNLYYYVKTSLDCSLFELIVILLKQN